MSGRIFGFQNLYGKQIVTSNFGNNVSAHILIMIFGTQSSSERNALIIKVRTYQSRGTILY